MNLKRETEQLLQFLDLACAEAKAKAGVEIKIVAGEATHEEYSQAYEQFRAFLNFGRITMVVGPVVSGDYLGRCSLFDLAREYPGRFQLFIPSQRQMSHWKLLLSSGTPRFLQIEADHGEPIALDKTCEKVLLSPSGIIKKNGSVAAKGRVLFPWPRVFRFPETFAELANSTLRAFEEVSYYGTHPYEPHSPCQPPVRTTEEITHLRSAFNPREVNRRIVVDCPRKCRVGKTLLLSIQILAHADRRSPKLYNHFAGAPSLLVHVSSSAFAIAGPAASMRVPFDRPSERVKFELVSTHAGEQQIEVQVFYGSDRIGYLTVPVQVSE